MLRMAGQWWHTPLIPAPGSKKQADLWEFEAILIHKAISRKPCLRGGGGEHKKLKISEWHSSVMWRFKSI